MTKPRVRKIKPIRAWAVGSNNIPCGGEIGYWIYNKMRTAKEISERFNKTYFKVEIRPIKKQRGKRG